MKLAKVAAWLLAFVFSASMFCNQAYAICTCGPPPILPPGCTCGDPTIKAVVYPSSITIPDSGSLTAVISGTVYDPSGYVIPGAKAWYFLWVPYPGVSVDYSTGVITVTSAAAAGTVDIYASYDDVYCAVPLTLRNAITPIILNEDYYGEEDGVIEIVVNPTNDQEEWFSVTPDATLDFDVALVGDGQSLDLTVYDDTMTEIPLTLTTDGDRVSAGLTLVANSLYYIKISAKSAAPPGQNDFTVKVQKYVNITVFRYDSDGNLIKQETKKTY